MAAARLVTSLAGAADQRAGAYSELTALAHGDAADATTGLSNATLHIGGLEGEALEDEAMLAERLGTFGTVLAVTLRSRCAVEAEQALQWGIVDWVVAPEALDEEALRIAKQLASGPPLAIAMAKQLIDQFHGESVRRGIREELLAQSALFKTEDYQEARSALREKRSPRYKGK